MIIARNKDVVLREFEESDIPKKIEWINNPQNNKYLHYDLPLEEGKTQQWFQKKDNTRRMDCVVEYEGIPAGICGFLQIDKKNAKAEYYITIGEPGLKRRGIAMKATEAMLEYAFSVLKMHKVYLEVDSQNEAAMNLYEKIGFQREGYFVDDLFSFRMSRFIDRARYAVTAAGGLRSLTYDMHPFRTGRAVA